jgi:hypothetical protein
MHETAQECADRLVEAYGRSRALVEADNLYNTYRGQGRGYWDEYYRKVIEIIISKSEKTERKPTWKEIISGKNINSSLRLIDMLHHCHYLGYRYFTWNGWVYIIEENLGTKTEWKESDIQ